MKSARKRAIGRAEKHSPFLRDALQARPDIVQIFIEKGATKAAELAISAGSETLDVALRRQRRALKKPVGGGEHTG
jgi:hypothetical protein